MHRLRLLIPFLLAGVCAHAAAGRPGAPIATRDGYTLILTLDTGALVRLDSVDTCAGPDHCVLYELVGMSPDRRFFDVEARAYESATRFWISRATGRRFEVYAEPHASPGLKYIVTANPSEFGGTNGVFIWEVARGELLEQFRLQPAEYGLYRFVRWSGVETAELEKFGAGGAACQVRLTRREGRWALEQRDTACK